MTITPTTTLITGAGKGLGLAAATRLAATGHVVYVTARDFDRARAVATAIGGRPVRLDVTSDESVAAAAATLAAETGHLDVLVNNAGITTPARPVDVTTADLERVYATNVFGPVRVLQAFLPLLRNSADPLVVNVSSTLGSLRRTTDPAAFESAFPTPAYASSKAALNMLTSQLAAVLPGIRLIAVSPGYTATDLNGFQGTETPDEGATHHRGDHRHDRCPDRLIRRRDGSDRLVRSGSDSGEPPASVRPSDWTSCVTLEWGVSRRHVRSLRPQRRTGPPDRGPSRRGGRRARD